MVALTALIDRLTTHRVRSGRLVIAYTVGLLFGAGLALAALLARPRPST